MTDYTDDNELAERLRAEVPERSDTYWDDIHARLATAVQSVDNRLSDNVTGRPTALGTDITTNNGTVLSFREQLGRRFGGVGALAVAAGLLLIVGLIVGTRMQLSDDTVDAGYAQDPSLMSPAELDELPGPRQNMDHWHAVYGVWDCTANDGAGDWVPAFQSTQDDTGIHSHGDGVIHIHPFFEYSAGPNATFNHFVSEMQFDLTDDAISLDDDQLLQEGTTCDGQEAVVHLRRWQEATTAVDETTSSHRTITENLNDERFYNDREVWILALAPLEADLPLPPADRFATLNNVSSAVAYNPETLTDRATGIELGTLDLPADSTSAIAIEMEALTARDFALIAALNVNHFLSIAQPALDSDAQTLELLMGPFQPSWVEDINTDTLEQLGLVLGNGTPRTLIAFDTTEASGAETCVALVDLFVIRDRVSMYECGFGSSAEPAFMLNATGLFGHGAPAGSEYMVAELQSGMRLATNVVDGWAYLNWIFTPDPLAELSFYDGSHQLLTTCTPIEETIACS